MRCNVKAGAVSATTIFNTTSRPAGRRFPTCRARRPDTCSIHGAHLSSLRSRSRGGRGHESKYTSTYESSPPSLLCSLLLGGRGLLDATHQRNGRGRGGLYHADEVAVPAVVLGKLCAHTQKQLRTSEAKQLRSSSSAEAEEAPEAKEAKKLKKLQKLRSSEAKKLSSSGPRATAAGLGAVVARLGGRRSRAGCPAGPPPVAAACRRRARRS